MPQTKKNKARASANTAVVPASPNNPMVPGTLPIIVSGSKKRGRRSSRRARASSSGPEGNPGAIVRRSFRDVYCDTMSSCAGMIVDAPDRYLASLINPRELPDTRVPDPFCRERTATYQSKVVFDVTGVNGAAVNGTNNHGRFCYVFNPIFQGIAAVFNVPGPHMQVAYKDGTNATAVWTNQFAAANPGTNFDTYLNDPENASFATATLTGLAQRARPVSMSVLASYTGNLTAGGGNIAAALLPGGVWADRLSNGSITTLSLTNWEQLARVPGAYDGPLVQGAYAYWMPDDESDYLLEDAQNSSAQESMNNHEYPLLVVSGKVQAPTAEPQLRLEVYINYEYTTVSRVVATAHGPKDITERMNAVRHLANQPTSMANDEHINWMRVVLGGVLGFAVGGPVGAAVGAAAGAGIGGIGSLKGI